MTDFQVDFRLVAPLSHGAFGATGGTDTVKALRRFPVLGPDGRSISVPAVSGNALRGRLRRLLAREMFERLDIDSTSREWDRVYGTVANGGLLDGYDPSADPAFIRGVREACPPLSALGAAMGKWMLPGRCSIGILWPVCDATVDAGLCSPAEKGRIPRLSDVEGETYHVRLPDRQEADGATPMPHGTETISVGVSLQSRISFAREATEVEIAAVVHGLTLIETLGGGGAVGLGRVLIRWRDAPPACQPYLDWLRDEADGDRIVELIAR